MAEPKASNPKQQLDQGICQQFGWSRRYFQDEATNRWAVEVRTGLGAEGLHRFTSDCDQAGKEGAKRGEAAAAALAVSGLDPIVQRHMAKPAVSMDAAFGAQFDAAARVVEPQSGDGGWGVFWQQNPRVVGIDVEGNSSMPPVLVQVATRSLVVLEAPRGGGRGGRAGSGGDSADPVAGLSPDLRRLLDDRSILKVMCEGSSGSDKRSLGLSGAEARADIVDLEDLATELAGPVAVQRGLARILGLALPRLPVRVAKERRDARWKGSKDAASPVMFFVAIEQGWRAPLGGVREVPPAVKRYAALDAWCTLVAWEGLVGEARPAASGAASQQAAPAPALAFS